MQIGKWQKTDIVEVLTDIDTPNKYCIYNDQGQFVSEGSREMQIREMQILRISKRQKRAIEKCSQMYYAK